MSQTDQNNMQKLRKPKNTSNKINNRISVCLYNIKSPFQWKWQKDSQKKKKIFAEASRILHQYPKKNQTKRNL